MKQQIITSAYQRIRQRLVARARSIVSDPDTANDMVQEAFCKVWVKTPAVQNTSQAEAMLTVAVKNVSIDNERRRASHPTNSLDDSSYELADNGESSGQPEFGELYESVTRLIDTQLSERDRMILYSRDRDGLEFDEIAQRFGVTEANARLIVSRSRKLIRNVYLSSLKS